MRKATESLNKASLTTATVLMGSSILTMVIGIAISHLISKILPPVELGNYYYIINVLAFSCVILTFGVFYSASRLILKTEDEIEIRRVHGCVVICLLILSIFIPLILVIISLLGVEIIRKNVFGLYWYSSLGALSILYASYFETVLPADKKIYILAKSRIYPKIIYLLFVVALSNVVPTTGENTGWLLFLLFASGVIGYSYFTMRLKPIFTGLNRTLSKLSEESKNYGIDVYVGSIFTVGGSSLAAILIGYFGENNEGVAYFALATSLCAPLTIIPAALIGANFRQFSINSRLSIEMVGALVMLMLSASIALILIAGNLVVVIWGAAYYQVKEYVQFLCVGYFLYAIADLYNKYLAANGEGKALRDGSFVVGSILILSTILFVQEYGGIGATYARISAGLFYIGTMLYFYKKRSKIL